MPVRTHYDCVQMFQPENLVQGRLSAQISRMLASTYWIFQLIKLVTILSGLLIIHQASIKPSDF